MTQSPPPRHPVLALALCLAGIPAMAAAAPQGNDTGLLDLSIEELMQLTVTTASKKAQPLDEVAAAVFVITAEDILRSGATSIPDVLRLAPGVQVAAIGQNKWEVSIRGFNSRFANKLLVLVDGRAIYSPAFSGVFWEHNDVPLDNIERIEVIRGPGGSVWGANAVNGIINIITRSAEDTQGGLASVALGDELRASGLVRYGLALDDETFLRLHANGKSVDGGMVLAGGNGPDDWSERQAGFRLDATRGLATVMFQGGVSDYRAGDLITAFTAAAPYAGPLATNGEGSTAYLLGRWETETDNGSRSWQAYLDHADHDIGAFRYRNDTLDLEYQDRVTGPVHDLNWGLGYRISRDGSSLQPYVVMADPGKTFHLYSAFIQDDITLLPKTWRLTLGSRFEHNDFTGFEVQPNIRLLWTPTSRDSLWGALSRAVRTPSRGETSSTAFISPPNPSLPFPISTFPLATSGDPAMSAEKLKALDLGWRRRWSPSLSSELAAFYYEYSDLRGALMNVFVPSFYGASPYIPLTLTNAVGATSYGLEANADWLPRQGWRLQASLSLFQIDDRHAAPGLTGVEFLGTDPSHQFSLHSSLDITPRTQWDVSLRHVGKLTGIAPAPTPIPAYTSLDMRLSWQPRSDLRISLVGQNLLDDKHQEVQMRNIVSVPVEIQRSVYVRLDWKF